MPLRTVDADVSERSGGSIATTSSRPTYGRSLHRIFGTARDWVTPAPRKGVVPTAAIDALASTVVAHRAHRPGSAGAIEAAVAGATLLTVVPLHRR